MPDQYGDPIDGEEEDTGGGSLDLGGLQGYAATLAARDKQESEAYNKAYAPLRKRYEDAAVRLREQRIGPSTSEKLYSLGSALAAPMGYKGIGAVAANVAPVLQEQARAKRLGEEGRRIALEELMGKQDEVTSIAELAKIKGRSSRQAQLDKLILAAGTSKTGFSPVDGKLYYTAGPKRGQMVENQTPVGADDKPVVIGDTMFRKDQKGNLVAVPRTAAQEVALAAEKKAAEKATEKAIDTADALPKIVATASETLRQIGELRAHPGLSAYVGRPNPLQGGFGPLGELRGTPAADFSSRLKQLQGGAFLEAFEALKGGGQITEIEGTKATQAKARMDGATSEQEFNDALNEFEGIVATGLQRAQAQATAAQRRAAAATGGINPSNFAPVKPGERPPLSSFVKGG